MLRKVGEIRLVNYNDISKFVSVILFIFPPMNGSVLTLYSQENSVAMQSSLKLTILLQSGHLIFVISGWVYALVSYINIR